MMLIKEKPILQLALSSILFGLGAVFVVFIDLGAVVIAFYRMFVAACLFALILMVKREPLSISFKTLLFSVLSGVFLGIDLSFWNTSILIIGPGIATILNSLQIFFMAGFGILLYKHKPSKKLWFSLVITFIGVVLLCSSEISGESEGLFGVMIGVLSGLAFALSMLALRQAGEYQTRSVTNTMFYASIAGAFATGAYAFIEGSSFVIPNIKSLIFILIYGGIIHVCAWFLMAYSIRYISVAVIGLVMCLEPVMVFFIDWSLLEKPITLIQLLGAAMTMGAIYLGSQSKPSS